jgi:methionyl-tRNA synthetase
MKKEYAEIFFLLQNFFQTFFSLRSIQFQLYLIGLKQNRSGISQATFNKLKESTDISEKAVQNPLNSTVELFHAHRHTDGHQKNN